MHLWELCRQSTEHGKLFETYKPELNFATLNNRLSGTFDYFIKDNKNMFYAEEFPTILGTSAPSINGAHVRTNGWELTLNWKDKIGKVGYRIGLNLSDNKTKSHFFK